MGTMFPGPGDTVYRNEAGEVLGWDGPDEPEYFDCCGITGRCVCDDYNGEDDYGDGNQVEDPEIVWTGPYNGVESKVFDR